MRQHKLPKWVSEKPKKEDLHKPRFWNKKNWWWCAPETGGKCTGRHRVHKPSACQGKEHKFPPKGDKARGQKRPAEEQPKDSEPNKQLKLAKALAALTMEDSSELE